jgi:serine/threonine protein phosphatase PrpC
MSSKGTKEKSIPTPVTDDRDMQSFTSVAGNGRSFSTCASTRLGTRKSQEDRLLMCEDFFGHCVLAVFDGTVGDFASHFSQGHYLHFLGESPSFQQLCKSLEEVAEGEEIPESVAKLAGLALAEGLKATDVALVKECAKINNNYASSTAVVTMITRGSLVSTAHLGDSRVAVGTSGQSAAFVTEDHKSDTPAEKARIESMGGSVVYLHKGKPFIRGGDFTARQAQGDRPMQLNYSRALGGKDLKMFGLSNDADIWQRQLTEDFIIVLGSDGLWDTISCNNAIHGAIQARQQGTNPAQFLVDMGLRGLRQRGSSDNVTVVCCFLDGGCYSSR